VGSYQAAADRLAVPVPVFKQNLLGARRLILERLQDDALKDTENECGCRDVRFQA
jgi:hypothetical protein